MNYADTHIHLDKYEFAVREQLVREAAAAGVNKLVAVSMNQESCAANLRLAQQFPAIVLPAFGFHPEQQCPNEEQEAQLFAWIEAHRHSAAAIGEVGLPYYTRKEREERGETLDITPYLRLLERFAAFSARHDLPIVLHAVYDDAPLACDILERHSVRRAHFHWFKGEHKTVRRMIDHGWHISVTPDVLYESEIQDLVRQVPLELLMTETDGPWPFAGPFAGQMTKPAMVKSVVEKIAELKGIDATIAQTALYENAAEFYQFVEKSN